MKTNPSVVVVLLLLCSNFATAQNQPLTLRQAIEQGLKSNKELTVSQLDIKYQQQLKNAAVDIPKMEFSGQFGQMNSYLKTDNNFSVSQTIPFPTVFLTNAALRIALVKSSQLKSDITRDELVYRIKQAYINLQYLYARQLLLEKQDSIYSGFFRSASLRYKVGESTLLEKSTAETQLNETLNILNQDKSNILIYQSHLQVLIGSEQAVSIADKEFSPKVIIEENNFKSLVSNSTVAFMLQQIEAADRQKKFEKAKALPDLTFGYFNQSLNGSPVDASGLKLANSVNRFQGFNIGASVPLFFSSCNSKIKSAAISKEIAEKNLESQQTILNGQYERAVQEYLKNKKSVAYYKNSGWPNAELLLSKSENAYRNGDISYAENLLNLRTANGIQENYLSAILQHNLSIALLEYLSGKN